MTAEQTRVALEPFPNRRYQVIYCDPPWSFRVWSKDTGHGRSAEAHYPTLSNADLAALPVVRLAEKDCALFMWATMPKLPECIAVMQAWGFAYTTVAFTWAKTTKRGAWHLGMGYYTRANAEVCLLGRRGTPRRVARNVRQLVVAPAVRHSAKPPEVRERIVALMGDVPRIELFARGDLPAGWDGWGNEYRP